MAAIKFYRETTLPSSLQPYAVYVVAPATKPDHIELYVTNNDGTKARRVVNEEDIRAIVSASLSSASNIQVVNDINARDGLNPTSTVYVFVKDATGDGSVQAGGATYLFDTATSSWIKVSEAESMDIATTWDALTGKPSSSVARIDQAVANTHTHANKTQLDKIGEDGEGNLTYGGKPVTTAWASVRW